MNNIEPIYITKEQESCILCKEKDNRQRNILHTPAGNIMHIGCFLETFGEIADILGKD